MTYDGSYECRHATMSRLASFVLTQGVKSAAKTRVVRALWKLSTLCSYPFAGHWFSVLYRVDFLEEY